MDYNGGNGGPIVDLRLLIESEIPEGRQNLENSYANLERVAAYCEANYLQAADKKAAFDETRRFTVQSLASVAYQINTLANGLLQMLSLQTDRISELDSQVNHISHIVDIHKEKVARREIGLLTRAKCAPRQHKIIAPANAEKPQRYQRRPIDFTVFDNLGHGVKLPNQQAQQWGMPFGGGRGSVGGRSLLARTASTTSGGSSASSEQFQYGGMVRGQGSGRGQYGVVGAHGQQLQQARFEQTRGNNSYSQITVSTAQNVDNGRFMEDVDYFPPPPLTPSEQDFGDQHSPPLPPPPMEDLSGHYGTPASLYGLRQVPDWAPINYVEKVVSLYDYSATKEDELTFQEGDIIFVVKKNDDGWYEGVLRGLTGLFPGNYVEPCL